MSMQKDSVRPGGGNKKRPSSVPLPSKVSLTGSCRGVLRTQAGCFAISHPHKLTGYKDPRSETNLRTLGGETTYKYFHEMTSGLPALQKPLGSKTFRPKLEPYKPLAMCNRNAVVFENEPIPAVRFCAPRNTHTEFDKKLYERQYFTHNQCMYPKWDNLPVGFQNGGIMSDFARTTHVSQLR